MAQAPTTAKKVDKVRTPIFRISFPSLMEATSFEGGKATYSAVMLLDKKAQATQEYKDLQRVAGAAIRAKWGNDKTKWPKGLRSPFRKGPEEKPHLDGYNEEGMVFARISTTTRPGVVDASRQPITDANEVYAGCYCRATVTAFAYDQKGNRGVSFGLHNVQKVRDGESFSGRVAAEDDFEEFTDGEGGASGSADAGDDFLS